MGAIEARGSSLQHRQGNELGTEGYKAVLQNLMTADIRTSGYPSPKESENTASSDSSTTIHSPIQIPKLIIDQQKPEVQSILLYLLNLNLHVPLSLPHVPTRHSSLSSPSSQAHTTPH